MSVTENAPITPQASQKSSFLVLLFSGFIDYAGVAMVYPLFAYILFEPTLNFLPEATSITTRGIWLGVLIALYPLVQFIFAPIFGAISDIKGRKKLLLLSFGVGLFGYAIAFIACLLHSIWLLALYRICVGVAAGNSSIVSAIVADLSSTEHKAKNYGLLNMSFGTGFTLGPFFSGILAHIFDLSIPFLVAFFLVALNLVLISWKLKETRPVVKKKKVHLFSSISQISRAVRMPELRFTFLSLFVFSFGWSLLVEFVSVFLIDRFQFSPQQTGLYYGYTGFFYSISAGFLIYPIIKRIRIERALFLSMLLSGIYILLLAVIKSPRLLWFYLPFSQFFLAFVYPSICAVVSTRVSQERQGEVMGVYQAVIALALTITPFCSGLFIGHYPILVVVLSALLMIVAAGISVVLRDDVPSFDVD